MTLGTLSIENVEKWKRKGRARCGVGREGWVGYGWVGQAGQ